MALARGFRFATVAGMAVAMAVVGASCGDGIKNKKPTFPVKGKLHVQSQPAVGATVIFHPVGESSPEEWTRGFPRATVKEDGTFTAETYGVEDGVPEGDYIVLISWPLKSADEEEESPAEPVDNEAGDNVDSAPNDRLKGAYLDPTRSPLRAKIEPKSNELAPFELN